MDRDDAIFALYFGRSYGTRAGRFWGKISTLLLIVEVVAGGFAFASFIAKYPGMGAGAGLAIAIAATINIAIAPKEKQIAAMLLRQKFAQAIAAEPEMSDAALTSRVRELQGEDPIEIEALRMPAWRDVCEEMGQQVSTEKRSIVELIAAALA